MDNSTPSVANAKPSDAERAVYTKPQLKRLGNVAEVTRTSSIFSNTADSSNILGSDYS